MPIALTPDLERILASKLQIGDDKPFAYVEIDWVLGVTTGGGVIDAVLSLGTAASDPFSNLGVMANPGNCIDGNDTTFGRVPDDVTGITGGRRGVWIDLGSVMEIQAVRIHTMDTRSLISDEVWYSTDNSSWSGGLLNTYSGGSFGPLTDADQDGVFTFGSSFMARYLRVDRLDLGTGLHYYAPYVIRTLAIYAVTASDTEAEIRTATYQCSRISIDRSRKTAAAELQADFSNETDDKGYYSEENPVFAPGNPIRAFIGHGVLANKVLRFTGFLENNGEHRDPKTTGVKAISRSRLLMDPHKFWTTASQEPTDANADRTEANGVFLNKSPEYIAAAILDLAGWPAADRDIQTTGISIPEYRLADGSALLDQISGDGRLNAIAGWDYREDHAGVVHLQPPLLMASSEPTPDWTLAPSVNVSAYDHQGDDEERVTRVRVSGQMTGSVPIWSEEWATTALKYPVGVAYRASAPDFVYVIDRVTQNLYKIRQSDQTVIGHWWMGASLTNQPIGLSIDPTNSAYFYVLDAHKPGSGTYTNCHVRKYAWSAPNTLVATTNLPDGQWSDMKFDGTHLWLTNYGDDKLYEKTFNAGGTAGATASFSYAGKTNPTGMYLNGTTIGLFFNGGAAFYLVDTSAPGTITGTQSTKGTHILGGEIVLPGGDELFAVNEVGDFGAASGHIWKFDLAQDVQIDVVKWATDQDLEDALGFQAGIEDRVHDLHPLDAAHPWIASIYEVALQTINSEAQAQAVADYQLTLLRRIRRILDLTAPGHEGLEINDAIRYPDPVAATDQIWMLDTLRESIDRTYTNSMSLLPWEAP